MERIDEEYLNDLIAMCQESEMTSSEYMEEVGYFLFSALDST